MLILSGALDENCINNFCNIKRMDNKERENYNFLILENLYFNDDMWNFSELNRYNRSDVHYKFKFSSINSQYRYYAKIVVLNELINNKCKMQTVHKYYANLVTIVNYLISEDILDARLITLNVIKKYLLKLEEKNSYSYITKISVVINKLLKVIEEGNKRNLKSIVDYVNEKVKIYEKFRPIKSLNQYIPDKFLDSLLKFAVDDSKNEKYTFTYRIFTCLLIILAETGMRIEEVSLLESGMLSSVVVDKRKINYLNFICPKGGTAGSEVKFTYCYMTDLAASAYKRAESLAELLIESLSQEVKNKLFFELLREKYPLKVGENDNFKNFNNKLSTEIVKDIEKISKKYLFLSDFTGKKIGDASNLREYNMRFIINNYYRLSKIDLSEKEKDELSYFTVNSKSRYEKFFGRGKNPVRKFDEIKDINYPYVNFHRFRVTVCTKLFEKRVPLDFIRNHMNHIEDDMTMYYIKTEKFQDELKENIEMIKLVSDENGYIELETDSDENDTIKEYNDKVNKINNFFKENRININSDIDRILKVFKKTDSLISENEFGICIKTVVNGICNKKKFFTSLDSNYYIGLNLETFKYIDCNYDRFKQKKKIIEHNKIISECDKDLTFEVEREYKALGYFLEKTLVKEIKLLENQIEVVGKEAVINKFTNLREIIENIDLIKKEVSIWLKNYMKK